MQLLRENLFFYTWPFYKTLVMQLKNAIPHPRFGSMHPQLQFTGMQQTGRRMNTPVNFMMTFLYRYVSVGKKLFMINQLHLQEKLP